MERCGVPYSCCRLEEGQMINIMCGFETTNRQVSSIAVFTFSQIFLQLVSHFQPEEVREQIYTDGCIRGLGFSLEQNALIVGVSCIAFFIPQVPSKRT